MMRPISLELWLFKDHTRKERVRSQNSMLWILEAIVQVNILFLKEYPHTPALYDAPVRYEEEKHGIEEWQDIPTTLEKGVADCEDLATWRAAELRMMNVDAHPFLRWREVGDDLRYHALVWLPGGKIEDPSRAMGMGLSAGAALPRKPIFVAPNYEDFTTIR